jgi:hypothetical protein
MKHFFIIASFLICSSQLFAADLGTDNAGNYTSDGFTNGANRGTGFQAWNIFSEGSAGTFIGDSTVGSGDINTSGQSFGMWGNPSGANYIHCYRKFAGGALNPGQSFSIKLAVDYRNGNKGLDLIAGGQNQFNVNVGGDDYTYEDKINGSGSVSLGWGWQADSIIEVTITQKISNGLIVSLKRTSDTFYDEVTLNGPIDEFQLYCGSTDAGDPNNFYANSMTIIPEPGMLLGLLSLPLLLIRKYA